MIVAFCDDHKQVTYRLDQDEHRIEKLENIVEDMRRVMWRAAVGVFFVAAGGSALGPSIKYLLTKFL